MKIKQLHGSLPAYRRRYSTAHFAKTKAHGARGLKTRFGSESQPSPLLPREISTSDSDKQSQPYAACPRLMLHDSGMPQTQRIRIGAHIPAPAQLASKLWQEFDLLPHFMRGPTVTPGHQRCVWLVNLNGRRVPWNAEPETPISTNSIVWKNRSRHGIWNEGSILFRCVKPHVCHLAIEVHFQLPYGDSCQHLLVDLTRELERMINHFISFVQIRKTAPAGTEPILLM